MGAFLDKLILITFKINSFVNDTHQNDETKLFFGQRIFKPFHQRIGRD